MRLASSVTAVSLLALLGGCRAALESGLSEEQSNDIVIALDQRGIQSEKAREPGGSSFSVWVGQSDVAAALAVLRDEDLPRQDDPGFAEVFGEGSLIPTASEEHARWMTALGGELSRSIEAIDGVIDARVHVALPDPGSVALLGDAPAPPRASVLVRYRGERPPYQEDEIRRLIAGAVPSLNADSVTIVGVRAVAPTRSGPELASLGPISVARSSASTLKWFLALLLGTNAALAIALVTTLMRRRAAGAAGGTEHETSEGGRP